MVIHQVDVPNHRNDTHSLKKLTPLHEDLQIAMSILGFAQVPEPASCRIHVDTNCGEDVILDGDTHSPNKVLPAEDTAPNNQTIVA